MSKKYKTTKKDFNEFKAECEKWIEYFGLKDWEIYIYRKDMEARADVLFNMSSRMANICLSNETSHTPDKYEIRRCGFHEVCELLLAPLSDVSQEYISRTEHDRRIHNIIRRLENTIFEESL